MWLYIKQDTYIFCVRVCVVSFGTHLCENPLEPDWREPNFLLSSRRNRKTRSSRGSRRGVTVGADSIAREGVTVVATEVGALGEVALALKLSQS